MIKKMAVGSEIDSYCGKCKMLLNHIVGAMVEDEPKRVRCLTCGSEHNHRIPKVKKPKAARASSARSSDGKSPRSISASKSAALAKWQAYIASWDDAIAKAYSIYDSFSINDFIAHSSFGRGVVVDIPSSDRIITLFDSGEKMLMQGRKRS